MPAGEVGKLSIKVFPDTKRLRPEIKRALDRIENNLRGRVYIDPILKRSALAAVRRDIKHGLDGVEARIGAQLENDNLTHIRQRLNNLNTSLNLDVDANTQHAHQQITHLRQKIEQTKAQLTIGANNTPAKQSLQNLKHQAANLEATLKLATDSARARGELDALRASIAQMDAVIDVQVDRSRLRHVKHEIDGLEGTATVNADADTGKAAAKLAWLSRPRVAHVRVEVANAGLSAAVAAISRLSGARVVNDGLMRVKDTLANLDRIAVRFAVTAPAVGVAVSAVLAATTAVAGLGKTLGAIAPAALAVPGIFGGIAAGAGVLVVALKDASTVLADLSEPLKQLGQNLSGAFWAQAAAPIRNLVASALPALEGSLTRIAAGFGAWGAAIANIGALHISGFEKTFSAAGTAIERAQSGVAAFTDGLLHLGEVGAQYLPALADHFNRLALRFQQWASSGAESGAIAASIKTAVTVAKEFGAVLVQVVGILGAVGQAASQASGGGLTALAGILRNVNAAMSSVGAQRAMITVFAAAREAVAALMPGISAIGDAFAALAPTLGVILPQAGRTLSTAFSALAAAISHPAFQSGLVSFFDGVNKAVQALAPSMPALGAAFGALATTAGQLLAQLGPLAAQLINGLAPIIQKLSPMLEPLITTLGGALLQILQTLTPVIDQLITQLLPPIIDVVTQIIPLIPQLVEALAPLISALAESLGTTLQALLPSIQVIVQELLPPLIALLAQIVPPLAEVIAKSAEFTALLLEQLGPALEALAPLVQITFEAIGTIISTALELIGTTLTAWLQILQGDWSGAWETIRSGTLSVWDSLCTSAATIGSQIVELWRASLNAQVAAARSGWQLIVQVHVSAWNTLRSGCSALWASMQSAVSSAMASISSFISSGWNTAKQITVSAWNSMRSAVSSGVSSAVSLVSSLPSKAAGALGGVGGILVGAGRSLIQGFINGISSMIGAVKSKLSSLTAMLPSWKGPAARDAVILRPAGRLVLDGFIRGLDDRSGAVQRALGSLTNSLSGQVELTAARSPQTGAIRFTETDKADYGYRDQPVVLNLVDSDGVLLGTIKSQVAQATAPVARTALRELRGIR